MNIDFNKYVITCGAVQTLTTQQHSLHLLTLAVRSVNHPFNYPFRREQTVMESAMNRYDLPSSMNKRYVVKSNINHEKEDTEHQTLKRDRELSRARKQDEKSAWTRSQEKTFIQPSGERYPQ